MCTFVASNLIDIHLSPRALLKTKIYFCLKIKAQLKRGFKVGLDCARPDIND